VFAIKLLLRPLVKLHVHPVQASVVGERTSGEISP
jgi:hypothetical protein